MKLDCIPFGTTDWNQVERTGIKAKPAWRSHLLSIEPGGKTDADA